MTDKGLVTNYVSIKRWFSITGALERLEKGNVKCRFVINIARLIKIYTLF